MSISVEKAGHLSKAIKRKTGMGLQDNGLTKHMVNRIIKEVAARS